MSKLPSPTDRESDSQRSSAASPPASPAVGEPVHRSTSYSSAWSTDVPPHHQGTSYFPPTSPATRRVPTRSLSVARSRGVNSDAEDLEDEAEDSATGDRGKRPSDDETPSPDEQGELEDGIRSGRQYTEDDPLTLKDRQSLMNVDHPFGLPIWKPALYKKSRTINRDAETALHAKPTAYGERLLYPGNILWTALFGLWLSFACLLVSTVLFFTPFGGRKYAPLVYGLGWYLLWPFGKYVEGFSDDADDSNEPNGTVTADAEGSRHHFQSISEENDGESTPRVRSPPSTFGRRLTPRRDLERDGIVDGERVAFANKTPGRSYGTITSKRLDPYVKTNAAEGWLGKTVFWLLLISLLAPLMLLACLICWFLVVTIPMAKLNWMLLKHMFQRPDSIRFCSAPPAIVVPSPLAPQRSEQQSNSQTSARETTYTLKTTRLSAGQADPYGTSSTVLLCTYRATGLQYYKYTVGGVNIFFVNLMAVVFFAIADGFILLRLKDNYENSGRPVPPILDLLASRALIFIVSLASVIPLSYFIGMAVASISAQSSIGMGAVINATFGSIIEIILYAIALTEGKGRLVEGSIIGSLLAGVLLLPGASMCSGAVFKKEQKFNAKSAGVTSTMLIMAIIGTLTPTLFYQTYGNVSLIIPVVSQPLNFYLVPANLRGMSGCERLLDVENAVGVRALLLRTPRSCQR